ncbi:MAG: hypothetical protein BWK73_44830 [Thiothrix lacustris]|uniref:Uncharacterized protein n=1 Tax=Thiothrix lacustris TaxID=525917 RepID=A0A1Y1QBL3_9GAMM|nr:MAG: hypothetical protein BWK73_44830 [Thiothrix lacustris]
MQTHDSNLRPSVRNKKRNSRLGTAPMDKTVSTDQHPTPFPTSGNNFRTLSPLECAAFALAQLYPDDPENLAADYAVALAEFERLQGVKKRTDTVAADAAAGDGT